MSCHFINDDCNNLYPVLMMMMTTEFEFQIEIQQILVTTAEVESIQKLSKFEE